MALLIRFAVWANRMCQRATRLGNVAVLLLLVLCLVELAGKGLLPRAGADISEVRAGVLAALILIFLPHLLAENRQARRAHLLKLSAAARARLRLVALLVLVLPVCLAILASSATAGLEVLRLLFIDRQALPAAWTLQLLIPIGFLLVTLQAVAEIIKALGMDRES